MTPQDFEALVSKAAAGDREALRAVPGAVEIFTDETARLAGKFVREDAVALIQERRELLRKASDLLGWGSQAEAHQPFVDLPQIPVEVKL